MGCRAGKILIGEAGEIALMALRLQLLTVRSRHRSGWHRVACSFARIRIVRVGPAGTRVARQGNAPRRDRGGSSWPWKRSLRKCGPDPAVGRHVILLASGGRTPRGIWMNWPGHREAGARTDDVERIESGDVVGARGAGGMLFAAGSKVVSPEGSQGGAAGAAVAMGSRRARGGRCGYADSCAQWLSCANDRWRETVVRAS